MMIRANREELLSVCGGLKHGTEEGDIMPILHVGKLRHGCKVMHQDSAAEQWQNQEQITDLLTPGSVVPMGKILLLQWGCGSG